MKITLNGEEQEVVYQADPHTVAGLKKLEMHDLGLIHASVRCYLDRLEASVALALSMGHHNPDDSKDHNWYLHDVALLRDVGNLNAAVAQAITEKEV